MVSLLTSPRETALVGAVAVFSAAISPLWNHNFGDVDYIVRLGVVVAGGLFALAGARGRARLARDRVRFQMLSGVAEISERGAGVDETLENLSDILVPAIADVCAIDLLRDGKLERLAVAAHGPHSGEIAAGLRERGSARRHERHRGRDADPRLPGRDAARGRARRATTWTSCARWASAPG